VLNFNPYNILAGLIFGTLGFGAWQYGRTLDRWKPKVIGIALMLYPYLVSVDWMLWGIGVALLILLWFQHDE
jgi:hypothetical protein